MIVRSLDPLTGDWNFGTGKNAYLQNNNAAVAQQIQTRLNSFLGNCFWDLAAGINWFVLLGGKDKTALDLAITTTILNTPDVQGVKQVVSVLDPKTRRFFIEYQVQTTYSMLTDTFTFNVGV